MELGVRCLWALVGTHPSLGDAVEELGGGLRISRALSYLLVIRRD